MRFTALTAIASAGLLVGCGGSDIPEAPVDSVPSASSVSESSVPSPPPGPAGAGSATVTLTGEGLSISGTYPAQLCGGPYILGEGVSYQTQAGDWRITVASETRASGTVPLNAPNGEVSVVVTANGPGRQFVRGPSNGGSLVIEEDFRHAVADLELRGLVGGGTARLAATFTCDAPA